MDSRRLEETGEDDASHSELLALREKLAGLVAGDIEVVIDFEMPPPAGSTKSVAAHRARTAQYKSHQVLALAPDSQAIAQACSYLVLRSLSRNTSVAPELRERLIKILVSAGYQRNQIEATLGRLLIDVDRRQSMWQRGQVRKLSSALAAAIRKLKSPGTR